MKENTLSPVKKFLFMLLPFLFFCFTCELFSYLYLSYRFRRFGFDLKVQGNSTMVENAYQVWEHPANYTTWSGRTHFDNYAFRRFNDVSIKKPKGVTRIFIMGGSTAFGSQAAPGSIFLKMSGQNEYASDKTISAWMEKILNDKYKNKKFEVINAATNWSKLHQQMINYLRKVRSFQPDMVISIDGQNDSSLKIVPGSLNFWDLTNTSYKNQLQSNMKHRLRPVFKNSYTAYLLAMLLFRGKTTYVDTSIVEKYSKIKRPKNYEEIMSNYYRENTNLVDKSAEEYTHILRYFNNVLKTDNVKHFFVLQPLTHLEHLKKLTKRESAIQGYLFSRLNRHYFRSNFYGKVVERCNEAKEEENLPFWYLKNVFKGESKDVYTDYCHFTPYGNKVFAEKLIEIAESNYPELFSLKAMNAL